MLLPLPTFRIFRHVITGLLVLSGLYLTSLHSYLFFHSLSEILSILVSFSIFLFAWNTRNFISDRYLLILGVSYLCCGWFDLLHTFAYKGVGIIETGSANLATQLWIASRFVESFSLLAVPFFFKRRTAIVKIFSVYILISSLITILLFFTDLFPDCYIEGIGLTPFKKISEYIICLVLMAAGIVLYCKRKSVEFVMYWLIMASIGFTIAAELAFTFYISIYGFSNLVGHLLKLVSIYLVYRAIVVNGLLDPYRIMFDKLADSKSALENYSRLLESRVEERTHELEHSNRKLHKLSKQLLKVGESERKRIARDLHDGIGQSLSALKFSVENAICRLTGQVTPDELIYLKNLVPVTQQAIGDVRRIIMDLRPSILDDLGILATINWFCREFNAIYTSIIIEKHIELEEEQIPQALKTIIYRFLQEGLNNVAKHSKADCVQIYLERRNGHIVFEVSDNGSGFNLTEESPSSMDRGFGLTGMRERVELSGAEFTINSLPGKGTSLRAAWPVHRDI